MTELISLCMISNTQTIYIVKLKYVATHTIFAKINIIESAELGKGDRISHFKVILLLYCTMASGSYLFQELLLQEEHRHNYTIEYTGQIPSCQRHL